MTAPAPGDRGPWLLWSVGLAAGLIGLVAFLLWGFRGAAYAFDLLVAYCL
jgi:hypothetical protein